MNPLPEGWFPVPFALAPEISHEVAAAILHDSGAVAEADADLDATVDNLAAVVRGLPVTESTVGRLWHGFGPVATGATADLSVERRNAETLESAAGAGFALVDRQRTQHLDGGGLATLSAVAPSGEEVAAFLLRVQVPSADGILIVDVLERDLAILGAVWDDAVAIARG